LAAKIDAAGKSRAVPVEVNDIPAGEIWGYVNLPVCSLNLSFAVGPKMTIITQTVMINSSSTKDSTSIVLGSEKLVSVEAAPNSKVFTAPLEVQRAQNSF